jgi:hypothetical protein
MVVSVRIARRTATGRVEVGPVIVTYTEYSDTHLESVRSSGSLWLYAPNTPTGARALRISEATGQVLQDTPVSPAMDRPIIAANGSGLFLAPTSNTGFLGPARAPNENGIIYRVGIGASAVQVFDASSGTAQFPGYVSWITGDGSSIWADICRRGVTAGCDVTRFDGLSPTPVFQVSDHDMTGSWVVGNAVQGFYGVVRASNDGYQETVKEQVVRIDPATGVVRPIATVSVPAFWQGNDTQGANSAALFDRALYLLVAPGYNASNPPGELYRIALIGNR